MTMLTRNEQISRLAIIALCAALAGCASADPIAYSGIQSSSQLAHNTQDNARHIPYRYATQVEWRNYDSVILDPVEVYRGTDNQFGDMSAEDRDSLARYMQGKFARKLKSRFALVGDVTQRTLRVHLTLTGASTTTPVLGTLSRLDIAGGLYNSVQAVRGGEGTFTGSVIYAVEIYDAPTNRLLSAYVTKQYPGSLNIMASFGSLSAAETGIDKGADALVAELQ